MVSPTPNALPAATVTAYNDACVVNSQAPPSSPIANALSRPLRVIVAEDCDIQSSSPSPPGIPTRAYDFIVKGKCNSPTSTGQQHATAIYQPSANAVSPASSVDSGVVVGGPSSPASLHEDERRKVLFTVAGDVIPAPSVFSFAEVQTVRATMDALPCEISGSWKFRERSVSECTVEARQLTVRRQQCILEEDEKAPDSPTPNTPPTVAPNSPLTFVMAEKNGLPGSATRKNGTILKGILKKSNAIYSSQQQLSPGQGMGPHHFRRTPTYFALSRSVSDLCEREEVVVSGDEGEMRSNLVRMNHAFNAMVLDNLCEEGEVGCEAKELGRVKCASPPILESSIDGSGSLGSLMSADSGDSLGVDVVAELQPRKKRVSFSEHVQARIYRSNSSILGQKKKNEKKHRTKRRRSESESSPPTNQGQSESAGECAFSVYVNRSLS